MATLSFENPLYLWYLLSIPLLILSHFYFLRYAKYRGMRFANFDALKRVKGEKFLTKNYTLLALRLVILLVLIFAASGTTLWYMGQASEKDFVIALDVSASMTSQDVSPTRMLAAKESINAFLDRLEEQEIAAEVGLLTFSGSTYIEELPTRDFSVIRTAVNEIQVRKEGGTDIAGAVVTGTNMLIGSSKGKSILFISDGSVTVSSRDDDSLRNALAYAQDEKVMIHSLGIGTNTGPLGYLPSYYNISAVFNEETLKKLANSTQGTFHMINNQAQEAQAFEEIGDSSAEALLDIDLSYGLLLVALLLIFVEWGLVSTRFRRLP